MAQDRKIDYDRLYRLGLIHPWFLREQDQLPLYEMIVNNNKVVVDVHRRFGKTTTSFVYIDEVSQVETLHWRVGGVTQKAIKEIYATVQSHIYRYAPKYQPTYYSDIDAYVFKDTGSTIRLFGNKDSEEANKSRGGECDGVYLDEYGYWRFKPRETLYSVLIPQMEHSKLQKIIITSTIPRDLTHDFIQQCAEARASGKFFFHDLKMSLNCGTKTQAQYDAIVQNMGGEDSEDFRREYMLHEIASSKDLVIPEAQDESKYVKEFNDKPHYRDEYVCFDLGLIDKYAGLFGFYHFELAQLFIEAESVDNYKTTEQIVFSARQIEHQYNYTKPLRIGDTEMQQLYDMTYTHGYNISAIKKTKDEASEGFKMRVINSIRMAFNNSRIVIHPRCSKLISQLRFGIWNEKRTDFERSDLLGHLDALMSLCYMWDNVNQLKNPYPALPPDVKPATHLIKPEMYTAVKKRSFKDVY